MSNKNTATKTKRILCIDGGGIRGTYPAAFLTGIEADISGSIGDYFDLICGTSTGGIIALGLGMGMKAEDILQIYVDRGDLIFGQSQRGLSQHISNITRNIRRLSRPKYSPDALKNALTDVFSDRKLGESSTRLLIPSWDSGIGAPYIFKTAHHERLRKDYKSSVVDAALATSAAPTYFPKHIIESGVGLVDGGVWANNPIALAVVEAITMLNWSADDLNILSIGCLNSPYSISDDAGFGEVASKLLDLFMDGQAKSAMGIAQLLTGDIHGEKAIHRIDQTVSPQMIKMDKTSLIAKFVSLGTSRARIEYPILKNTFFDKQAAKFDPVYSL